MSIYIFIIKDNSIGKSIYTSCINICNDSISIGYIISITIINIISIGLTIIYINIIT